MPNLKTIKLHRVQHSFRHSNAIYRAFVGGRGAGKSWVGAYDLLRRVRPNRTYLVGSPTGILMQDTTYPTLKKLAEELGVWHSVKLTPYPTATIRTGKGYCEVRFRTAEDPERMRGPNLSGCWLDEASLMSEHAYTINIAALRESGEQGWLSATFTPKGPTHWTYQTFATGKPDTAMFRSRTGDNPFLPKDFEATLHAQYGETQFARQELGGEFVQIAGAEFPAEWFDWPGFWFDQFLTENVTHKILYLDPSKGVRDFPGDAKTGKEPDWQAYVSAALVKEKVEGNLKNILYLDAHLNREPVIDMIERGMRITKEFRPDCVVFEDNGTMGFMASEVRRAAAKYDVLTQWNSITHKVPKIQRMRVLGGYLSQRQIRIRSSPGGKLMRAQMGDVPFGEYDDAVDAAAGAIEALGMLLNQR